MPSTAAAPYWGLRGQRLNQAVASLAGLGFFLFGYDQGVMGGLLTLPTFVEVFPEMDTISKHLSAEQKSKNSTIQGVAIALYEIGCMIGALSCSSLGEKLGRRKTIFIGAFVMIIGSIIQSASFGLAQFIVGRVVTGFGNGFITATVPVWQSECSPARQRGKLVMLEGCLITAGIMISYWVDLAFYFTNESSVSWRMPIALQIVFAVIIMSTVLTLPESPRWLVKKGQVQQAREVFASLAGVEENHHTVEKLMKQVEDSVANCPPPSIMALFKNGKSRNFQRTTLAVVSQCFQQISGINLITYYAATVYENYLHLGPVLSRVLAACTGTEFFLASWGGVYAIERFGRRKLMIGGAAGMAISMAILAVSVWKIEQNGPDSKDIGPAISATVFFFVYNTFFGIGWLGMSWLYSAEIPGLEIRSAATGLSTASNWIFNFLIVLITPICFDHIGWKTYLVFAVVNAFIVPSVYFFFPETAYRSLEEIDEIFAVSGWLSVVNNARPSVTPLSKNDEGSMKAEAAVASGKDDSSEEK
uniref:Hexose transporter HXT1 n=1 Tax=Puccinia striiformis f. sp. tritici TaxID=168172 RepID=A0A7D4Y2Z0_9BASI|nr:hexose transporter HXT1 [Puccinia striiformis f. sp. tritici]